MRSADGPLREQRPARSARQTGGGASTGLDQTPDPRIHVEIIEVVNDVQQNGDDKGVSTSTTSADDTTWWDEEDVEECR